MQKGFSPGKNRLQQIKKFKMFYVTPNRLKEKLIESPTTIICKPEFRHHLLHHQYQGCLVELKIYLVLAVVLAEVEKHQKKCIKRDQNRALRNQIRTLKNQDQNRALRNNL